MVVNHTNDGVLAGV